MCYTFCNNPTTMTLKNQEEYHECNISLDPRRAGVEKLARDGQVWYEGGGTGYWG